MTLVVRFDEEALVEIRIAADWYDHERRGLGDEFLQALHARVVELSTTPNLGGRLPGAPPEFVARRVLLNRFPYVIVFVRAIDEIRVIAVMHARRRPGYWMKRL